jgi:hypothetical protein
VASIVLPGVQRGELRLKLAGIPREALDALALLCDDLGRGAFDELGVAQLALGLPNLGLRLVEALGETVSQLAGESVALDVQRRRASR